MSATTVLFRLRAASGAPLAGIRISARLTSHDIDDGELVAQQTISAVTDASGNASLSLWPNTRGQRGTQYRVEWADATGRLLDSYTITVPESAVALHAEDLRGLPAPIPPDQSALIIARAEEAIAAAQAAAGGSAALPPGGATGEVLAKLSTADGDAGWVAPAAHSHTADQIADATATGRTLLTAADAAAARAAIGAGTSSFSGVYADLSGLPVLGAAAALDVGTSAGTVAAGDDARLLDARTPTASGMAATTHAAPSKAAPDDDDELPLANSASAWALARLSWANLKATLRGYFDTVYQAASANLAAWAALATSAKQDTLVSGSNIKTINGSSLLGSGDVAVSAAAGGADRQVQINSAGSFAGAPLWAPNENTVEQRNGATAQSCYIYNTRTDASNYERGFVRWNNNVLEIGAEKAGTGAARALWLKPNGQSIYVGDSNASVNFINYGTNNANGAIRFLDPTGSGWEIGFGAALGLRPTNASQFIAGYGAWGRNASPLKITGGNAAGPSGLNLNGGALLLKGGSSTGTGTPGRVLIEALPSAPTDSMLGNSQINLYLDEAGNALKVRVKYSNGTLKTASIALT
ncbi:MAG: hypothetical protein Fur0019_18840 [Tibeticola sp.]